MGGGKQLCSIQAAPADRLFSVSVVCERFYVCVCVCVLFFFFSGRTIVLQYCVVHHRESDTSLHISPPSGTSVVPCPVLTVAS